MRYRIKIVTFKSGEVEYYAQFRRWYGWWSVNPIYDYGEGYKPRVHYTREDALRDIDNDYNDATNTQTIEFEYIAKP